MREIEHAFSMKIPAAISMVESSHELNLKLRQSNLLPKEQNNQNNLLKDSESLSLSINSASN